MVAVTAEVVERKQAHVRDSAHSLCEYAIRNLALTRGKDAAYLEVLAILNRIIPTSERK